PVDVDWMAEDLFDGLELTDDVIVEDDVLPSMLLAVPIFEPGVSVPRTIPIQDLPSSQREVGRDRKTDVADPVAETDRAVHPDVRAAVEVLVGQGIAYLGR